MRSGSWAVSASAASARSSVSASSTVSIRLLEPPGASWLVMPTRQRRGHSRLPPSVSSAPVISLSSVVLPVPLRPTKPTRRTTPFLWRYADPSPLLLRAGELTPIEKAERRVLVLSNPGLGPDATMATPSIYLGLQLIQPGETAPCHKHTPSAIRFVIE